jgi:hypothetical protein
MKMIIKAIQNVLWVKFALGAGLVGSLVVGVIPLGPIGSLTANQYYYIIQTGLQYKLV